MVALLITELFSFAVVQGRLKTSIAVSGSTRRTQIIAKQRREQQHRENRHRKETEVGASNVPLY